MNIAALGINIFGRRGNSMEWDGGLKRAECPLVWNAAAHNVSSSVPLWQLIIHLPSLPSLPHLFVGRPLFCLPELTLALIRSPAAKLRGHYVVSAN